MMVLAVMVTSAGHPGCQVVMVPSREMTLVWPVTGDRGLTMGGHTGHNYFINTHRHEAEMLGRVCGAINGRSFICRGDHRERLRPGPFITRVINCGEIIAEPAMGDGARPGGATLTHSSSDLGMDNPGVTEYQWRAQASPGVIKCRLRGHT